MRVTCLLVVCFFFFAGVKAQNQKTFSLDSGRFTARYFDSNIIRISYNQSSFMQNENLSDAVILKPQQSFGAHRIEIIDGALVIAHGGGQLAIKPHAAAGFQKGLRFSLAEGEKIFGAGERALPLDRRGYRLNLYNNPWYGYGEGADNLNYSVPFITSSKGYGLYFDNPAKGVLDIGKTVKNALDYGTVSGELNVYVIVGDYRQVLQSYHKLTGTQPLPPKWAFGNLMSRFGYTSEAEVREILQKMKEQHIPVDAVIFDLFWFGDSIKGTLGNLEWINKEKWPDPKKMIADFKKDHIQTILVTEPFFVETSKNYKASLPYLSVDSARKPYYLTDFYFGRGGLLDIFRRDAQQWFWQFYKRQMQLGVEAWWGDLGEPEKHPANLFHNLRDLGHSRLFRSDEVHNIYGHTWTQMLYNNYAKEYPQKRLFSLNRSGFAGSQRFGIFPWTGDVSRSWSGLKAQLPILLGMSMSGVPYVHSDAGGFAGGEGDNELYVRWLQFAAFTPVFRPHGTALYKVEPAAFSYPSEAALIAEPFRSHAKKAISLRYQFLPYNYSLAYQQARSGKPLIAPLYYHFPTDTTLLNIADEYMWGENMLFAPVIEKGAMNRRFYLPEGNWLNFFNMQVLHGKQWHTESTSLDKLHLFIKEGGFVAMGSPFIRNTSEKTKGPVELIYFPSEKSSSFELYSDDGVSRDAIAGRKYGLVRFHSNGLKNNKLRITVSNEAGGSGKERYLLSVAGLQSRPGTVLLNGKPYHAFYFRPGAQVYATGLLNIDFESGRKPVTIEFAW